MSPERLTRQTLQRVAENRIRAAMENGEFENLPGLGKEALRTAEGIFVETPSRAAPETLQTST